MYQAASRKLSPFTVVKLAAALAHEQVHHTDDEPAAYRLQSDFVRSRLNGLPWRQKEDARRHLAELEARARASAWVDWRRREMERHD